MRLGELLVGTGDVTPEQVQSALSRQIIHGGRLGTNLVEINAISVEQLAHGLGRQHQRPPALEAHYNLLDRSLTEFLSPELAATWHAVPLGRTGSEGAQIAIATTDLFESDTLHELQHIFGATIVEAVTPEMRLLYWLERVYGIERVNRFKRVDQRAKTIEGEYILGEAGAEKRGYVNTLSDVEEVTDTSRLARIAVKRVAVPLSGEIDIPVDPDDPETFMRSVRQANSRSSMSDLVSFLLENGFNGVFSAGMLLVVRKQILVAWKGFVRSDPEKCVDALAIPLDSPSLLRQTWANNDSFFGLPDTPANIDLRLWHYLGQEPGEVAVLPVEVDGEIACILYVQSSGPIPAEHAGTLGELARSVSACLTRLIRNAGR